MLQIKLDALQVENALKIHHPQRVRRALRSALSSTGYGMMRAIQARIRSYTARTGGRLRHQQNCPKRTARQKKATPALGKGRGWAWWAKFVKYRVHAGTTEMAVAIEPGKDQKRGSQDMEGNFFTPSGAGSASGPLQAWMQPRPIGRLFGAVFQKMEHGRIIRATPAMRRHLAAGGMPIGRGRQHLDWRPRPAFRPVFERNRTAAMVGIRQKFLANLERYGANP